MRKDWIDLFKAFKQFKPFKPLESRSERGMNNCRVGEDVEAVEWEEVR